MSRETARSETTAAILTAARGQLAEVGPAALSLRAVAREIGMVSSAVYRYVAGRDDLLTLLIVQCYDELGATLENADPTEESPRTRWITVCRAIRTWAAQHPHEYALLYGSPVPGYVAPTITIGPATRPTFVLVGIVVDGNRGRRRRGVRRGARYDGDNYIAALDTVVGLYEERTGKDIGSVVDADLVARTLTAWTTVFGVVSFERFGHLVGSVTDAGLFFDDVIENLADTLGL